MLTKKLLFSSCCISAIYILLLKAVISLQWIYFPFLILAIAIVKLDRRAHRITS